MDGLVRAADAVLESDKLSSSLQELHGSILALSKKIQTLAASEEIDRLISTQTTSNAPRASSLATNEQKLEALKDIYKQFLLLQDSILKKQEERVAISNNILVDYSNDGHYSDQMTRRLSLVSRLSQDSADLKLKMNDFVQTLKNFESKMKLERLNMTEKESNGDELSRDNWTKDSGSERSGFSNLQSAFELNHSTYDEQKKKMEGFIGALGTLNEKMAKEEDLMKSETQSAFSDSKHSDHSSIRVGKPQADTSIQKTINYFSRSEKKPTTPAEEHIVIPQKVIFSKTQVVTGSLGQGVNESAGPIKQDDNIPKHTTPQKQRLSIIDQLKQQLQADSPEKTSTEQALLGPKVEVQTPDSKPAYSEEQIDRPQVSTPPRSIDDLFDSLSERTFNEAERLNMGQIWQNILKKTDELTGELQKKLAPEILKSEQQSEFISVASRSIGSGRDKKHFQEGSSQKPEDLANKFDFKK
jgi:hypothetical protein